MWTDPEYDALVELRVLGALVAHVGADTDFTAIMLAAGSAAKRLRAIVDALPADADRNVAGAAAELCLTIQAVALACVVSPAGPLDVPDDCRLTPAERATAFEALLVPVRQFLCGESPAQTAC